MKNKEPLWLFRTRDKLKKERLISHIERLERLINQDHSELKTKEIIADISGQEFEDYEIDNHIEDRDNLMEFDDLIRAQMLVSICGYFEYAVKRILNNYKANSLDKSDGLKKVILMLKKLEIIEFPYYNTLEEYLIIRNTCVHSNNISNEDNPKLASARKPFMGIKGMKLEHYKSSEEYKGKGKIILEKEFLPEALKFHFDVITKVHEYVVKNNTE